VIFLLDKGEMGASLKTNIQELRNRLLKESKPANVSPRQQKVVIKCN
jgi:hypothetical protein